MQGRGGKGFFSKKSRSKPGRQTGTPPSLSRKRGVFKLELEIGRPLMRNRRERGIRGEGAAPGGVSAVTSRMNYFCGWASSRWMESIITLPPPSPIPNHLFCFNFALITQKIKPTVESLGFWMI